MKKEILRFAVASKTGMAIDEHFGHAKHFDIYHVSTDGVQLTEQRKVDHYCLGGHSDKAAMPKILDTIGDCSAVFVARIGDGPKEKLYARGISAVSEYPWEEVPLALYDYYNKQFE